MGGIGERKRGGDFGRRMMMFESMVENPADFWGTRGGRASARKIFDMGARSGQRNARLHSEGRVQEK
jgi:hypothetical protein